MVTTYDIFSVFSNGYNCDLLVLKSAKFSAKNLRKYQLLFRNDGYDEAVSSLFSISGAVLRNNTSRTNLLQPNRIYMAVFFGYLVESDAMQCTQLYISETGPLDKSSLARQQKHMVMYNWSPCMVVCPKFGHSAQSQDIYLSS